MKMIAIVALALVAAAVAAPADVVESFKIIRSDVQQQPDGPYAYNYETENGISAQEEGAFKEVVNEENKPVKVLVVRGSYSYTDQEGKPVSVTYFADDSGFHAEGDHLPKAPVAARR